MTDLLHSPGVLALELSAGAAPERLCLTRDEAAELAAHIAADLARLLPADAAGEGAHGADPVKLGAQGADLVVLGALYDQAQLLRPGWPLFAELADLAQPRSVAQPDGHRQVMAFGSHDGEMPSPLFLPEDQLGTGSMLLLPWMLSAPAQLAQALGQRMERDFVAKGEAGSRTADFLMRTLGIRLEHARYLTRHDVCALCCVQMEHAGFSALWQMLECALLAPEREAEALSSRGRHWRYDQGAAHCALPDYAGWLAQQGHVLAAAERAHGYAGWLFELRQFAALLAAHDLPLRLDGAAAGLSLPTRIIAEADAALPPPQLYAHEARGLGLVVVSVAQPGASPRLLAEAWPLDAAGVEAGIAELAQRFGATAGLQRLGGIVLNADASDLAVPAGAPRLH
jgi:hypothetical protein